MKKAFALVLTLILLLGACSGAMADLQLGKEVIKEVQQMLNDAGYDCGKPDGAAGKKTQAAITAFQEDHGMEATGAFSYELLLELTLASAKDLYVANSTEELYDPQIFSFTHFVNTTERVKAAAGEENIEDAASQMLWTRMPLVAVDEDGLYAFLGRQVKMAYWAGDGISEEPFGALFLAAVTDDNEINRTEYEAVAAFLELANRIYGGTEEDLANLMAALGEAPAWDDEVSVAEWGRTIVVPFGTGVASFGIPANAQVCVSSQAHTEDWENHDLDVSFDGAPVEPEEGAGEDGGVTTYQGDDVPELPADVVEATGGIPDTLDGISEQYDMTEAMAFCQQLKPDEALKSLVESGSCAIPAPADDAWKPEENVRLMSFSLNEDDDLVGTDIALDFDSGDGLVTVTAADPLPDSADLWDFTIVGPNGTEYLASIDYDLDGNEVVGRVIKISDHIDLDSGSYRYLREHGEYSEPSWDNDMVAIVQLNEDGDFAFRWVGNYDFASGELDNLECYQFND